MYSFRLTSVEQQNDSYTVINDSYTIHAACKVEFQPFTHSHGRTHSWRFSSFFFFFNTKRQLQPVVRRTATLTRITLYTYFLRLQTHASRSNGSSRLCARTTPELQDGTRHMYVCTMCMYVRLTGDWFLPSTMKNAAVQYTAVQYTALGGLLYSILL